MLDTDFTLDVVGGYSFEEFGQKGQTRRRFPDRVRRMTEEVVKLKSDLKHTTLARARSEGREYEARNSLRAPERAMGCTKRLARGQGWAAVCLV